MSDISNISGTHRLTSKAKVSLESVQKEMPAESSQETHEINKLEGKVDDIKHAFELVTDIRNSLETALKNLPSSD